MKKQRRKRDDDIYQTDERTSKAVADDIFGWTAVARDLSSVEEKRRRLIRNNVCTEIKEDAYTKQLENKLEQVLTEMEGVGRWSES